jgi:ATP:ADP antiporter, AAA family
LYARFANRVPRGRLVVSVTLFFVIHFLLFYVGSLFEPVRRHLGLFFYLWVGVFNMMLVAQFWAFANDVYTEEQGKRLFPLVGLGASVGAAAGSKVTDILAEPLGRYPLLLVSAALLTSCAFLFDATHRRERHSNLRGEEDSQRGKPPQSLPPRSQNGAFGLVWNNYYLRLIAMFSLIFTLVNSNGEYMLGKLFKQNAAEAIAAGTLAPEALGDFLTAQSASFYFYVNVFGVLLQTFVVSRLVKYGGLSLAFFVLPLIALVGNAIFLAAPLLTVMRTSKIAENATDYSVNNTVRNMLWLPTTRAMKYQAKQAVDSFFVRMGDVSSSGLVALLVGVWTLQLRSFSLVNLGLIALWLVLARGIILENRRLGARKVGT